MTNKNGTYFAFEGLGKTYPHISDFKYFSAMQAWSAGKHIEFKFVNSHDKTNAIHDTSKRATLEARIRERLAASKNVVLMISRDTRQSDSTLSYEIEKAVDTYKLPLIIAYAGHEFMLKPTSHFKEWPNELTSRIYNGTARAIHIPFNKDAILDAIGKFTVNSKQPNGSLAFYTRQAQVNWGCL